MALTNTAPNAAGDSTLSSAPPPTSANGYPSGGNTLVITSAITSGGVFRLIVGDTVFTATSGGIGPFRYVVLYNATNTNKLIGYYDYGQSVTLNVNDTFTVDFDPDNGVLTIV